jgi:hypothetical protein
MISIEDLWNSEKYNPLKTLRYQEIVEFVFENIKLKNSATRWYFIYNFFTLALLILAAIYGPNSGGHLFKNISRSLLWGALSGSIFIIPVHEIIHGISYLLQGAPKIHFGADFKQMIFYVASDKYIIDRKKFYIVALSPFILINLITLFVAIINPQWIIFSLCFLLFHNIMCIGDFAMVSFFLKHRDKELYTYDDHNEKISYIFEKRRDVRLR